MLGPSRATPTRRLLAVLAATVLALGAGLMTGAPASASAGEVVGQVNGARAANGLPALSTAGDLNAVAQSWANQMASDGQLRHNPGLSGQVSGWSLVGENVGTGANVSVVHDAFMNSSGHRNNILGKYTQIGVGVASAGPAVWVVHVFRTPAGAPAPAPAPPPPAPAPAPPPPPAPAPAPPPAPKPAPAPAPAPEVRAAKRTEAPAPAPAPAPDPAPVAEAPVEAPAAPPVPVVEPSSPAALASFANDRLMRSIGGRGPATIWAHFAV